MLKRWLSGAAPAGGVRGAGSPPPEAATAGSRAALMSEGVARFRDGDFRGAAELFERCVETAHDDAQAHLNLGLARQRLGQLDDAADCFTMALHFAPESAEAHFNLGVSELEAGDYGTAARRFEEAVRLRPGYPEALSNLGLLLFRHLGHFDEAETALAAALASRPRFADALTNLGMLRHDQGRFEEAARLYDEALREDPAQDEARLNRSLLLLAGGDFAAGWEGYEARKRASSHFVPRFEQIPEWDGAAAPERTVLVYGEQGLGDEIMFASCLPDAIARLKHCVIDCSPRLAPIFARSFPAATVHGGAQTDADPSWLATAPAVDARIAIGSLPGLFRRRAEAFPRHSGYLKADAQKAASWRERLAQLGPGMNIGLSWRGGTAATRRDLRSIPLEQMLPLLRLPGVRFISLQYTDCTAELRRVGADHGVEVEHWPEVIADLDQTAALVAALDLVVSVQTAVVHLAGALGKPAWVMVPAVPEWRYLRAGIATPWYPSVRLIRQQTAGEWQPVIDCLALELECQARGRS